MSIQPALHPRSATPRNRRRYDDGCAAAHALDLIGERWALLVVRELLLGPRRFSDLRNALSGISPNVLTQRLSDLEDTGVVARTTLPPPASCQVYGLTPWGEGLEPVLMELLKWGVRSKAFERGQALTADAMALSLKAMFSPTCAHDIAVRITIVMGRYSYHVEIEQGRIAVWRGNEPCRPAESVCWAMATLEAMPVAVLRLAYGKRPLHEAIEAGDCRIRGSKDALQQFFSCFHVPPPVQ